MDNDKPINGTLFFISNSILSQHFMLNRCSLHAVKLSHTWAWNCHNCNHQQRKSKNILHIINVFLVLWYRVLHLTKSIYSTEQFTFRLRYQQPEMRPSVYTTISRSRLSGSSSSIRRSSPILLCDRVISTVIQPRRLHGKGHYVQEQYKARQKNTVLYYKSEGNH